MCMKRKTCSYSIGVVCNRLISPRWLFTIDKNDIYISSETTNQDIKLTIHESGQCHIKIEYKTLCRFKQSPRNQDTYIEKWFLKNYKAILCQSICRIVIPFSSLSSSEFTKTPDDVITLSDVSKTLNLNCFITSPCPLGQIIETDAAIIYQKQLSNLKYFVVTYTENNSCIEEETDMRRNIIDNLKDNGMWDTLPNKTYGVAVAHNKENLCSLIQYRLTK